jgi:hypothetical protein
MKSLNNKYLKNNFFSCIKKRINGEKKIFIKNLKKGKINLRQIYNFVRNKIFN